MIILKPRERPYKKYNGNNTLKFEQEKNRLLRHNINLMDKIIKNDFYVSDTNLINLDFTKFHVFNGELVPIKDKENYNKDIKQKQNNQYLKTQQYFNIHFFNDLVFIYKIYKNLRDLLKFNEPLILFSPVNLIDFVFLENQTLIQFINTNPPDILKITQFAKTQQIETMKMLNRLFHNFMDKNKIILDTLTTYSTKSYEKKSINLRNTIEDLYVLITDNIEILNIIFLNILKVKRLLNIYNRINK